jgi:hypothetical protein
LSLAGYLQYKQQMLQIFRPAWLVLYTRVFKYLSITNKMQRYTMIFITINALHVSGGSSAHHQELKTVNTALGICRAFTASYRLLTQAVKARQIPDAVYTGLSS